MSRRVGSSIAASEWRNLSPENHARLDGLRHAATRLWSDLVERYGAIALRIVDHRPG